MTGAAGAQAPGRHAIVLAAGAGSRLRAAEPVKPLAEVGGRPLLLKVIDTLAGAGARDVTVVTGHAAAEIEALLPRAAIPATAVHNPDWATSSNGRSLLAAADRVQPGTFLSMADHLLAPALAARLVAGATRPLALAVDRRLGHPWVDEADVTRVRTQGARILAIGKGLKLYDAYDTGLFLIGPELPDALRHRPDPSISAGVAALAARGLAEAVDVGDAPWLDVDDPRALTLARGAWEW